MSFIVLCHFSMNLVLFLLAMELQQQSNQLLKLIEVILRGVNRSNQLKIIYQPGGSGVPDEEKYVKYVQMAPKNQQKPR